MEDTFTLLIATIAAITSVFYCTRIWNWYTIWKKTPVFSPPSIKQISHPSISVLIPFRDESSNLPPLLRSLALQKGINWEVILIDDHSTDDGSSVIESYRSQLPVKLKVLTNCGEGKKAALLTGANIAIGDYLLMTDADCIMPDSWISTFQQWIATKNSELIIGPVFLTGANTFFHRFQKRDFLSLQISGAAAALNNRPIMSNGANLACRRDLFLASNLKTDFASGDDMFLLEWTKQQKKSITYLKSTLAMVHTVTEKSWSGFFTQRARWASKAKGYKDRDIISTGLLVAGTNALLLACLTLSIIHPLFVFVWLFLFLLKSVFDFRLLRLGADFWNYHDRFPEFLLTQFLYPLYILITITYPVFRPLRWKKRTI